VFLEPVNWTDDDWIIVGVDGTARGGICIENGICSLLPEEEPRHQRWSVNKNEASFLRNPDYNNYYIKDDGSFSLKGSIDTLNGLGNPTFIGIRQKEFACTADCIINGESMVQGQEAGLTVYMDERTHHDLSVKKDVDKYHITLRLHIGGLELIAGELTVNNSDIKIKVEAKASQYLFYANDNYGEYHLLGSADPKYLSSEVAEGFTGVFIAAYCISNEMGESNWVEFRTN
jgi:alpha-N-arabinofuranosidase